MYLQVAEANRVFEEMNEDQFDERQQRYNNDDFIVDDDGLGYKDHGGEIWDQPEAEMGGKKKRPKKVEEGSIE